MSMSARIRDRSKDFMACAGMFLCISVCALCFLCGCKKEATVPAVPASVAKKSTATESKKVKDFHVRLERLMEPMTYHYSQAGKPDPFQSFLKTTPKAQKIVTKKTRKKREFKRPERCATPLECMDVGQLRLVGIIGLEKGSMIAMAQDAAGIGYFLRPGVRVGYRSGRVTEIYSDRVTVEEQAEDIRGELVMRKRILFLHPEEK